MSVVRRVGVEVLVIGVPLAAVLLSHPTRFAFAFPAAVVACLALPLRLRWPWLAVLACLPTLVGGLGWPPSIVALYHLGRHTELRATIAWVTAAFFALAIPVQLDFTSTIRDQAMSLMFSLVAAGGPAAMGVVLRLHSHLDASLADLDRARQAELEARADQARSEERTRIAREIHDHVGHNATLIAVQSAALAATTTDPAAKEIAHRLRHLAKQSLAETRATLGLVAPDRHGIDDIPTLITQTRHAGVQVTYESSPITASPLVSRAIYRVVQESLTNAVKHAPGAPVQVVLEPSPGRVRVAVTNGPATRPHDVDTRGGTGLAGLTERVHTADGTLTAAPTASGGFAVVADLPTKVGPPHPTLAGIPHPSNQP
ncbi:two component sensor kinase [Alloactinosynnema sp. L-07]|uniref:sensor histidine kinase n=1 Tax=Alloactinosynnema sp. L-07 TaxID=1653480 RepID=UPI00065F05DA|nr:histidine kinase [Alloactinosynnema sp. L-07]CRK57588.1 two component sensor kinase [Alloactinosynnema sp. L-07]